MPLQQTYPGVYIQEEPSGVRTIMGVSTSVAIFIGRTKWGPINEPVLCLNYSDFERSFCTDASQGDMVWAVRLFFLNGGTQCYILRIANNAKIATVKLPDAGPTPADSLVINARYEGELGNSIRVVIDYGTPVVTATFNLTLSRLVTNKFDTLVETDVQKWIGLSMDTSSPRFVETYVNYKWAKVSRASATADRPAVTATAVALTTGHNGNAPTAANYDSAYMVIDKEVDIFNLLVLPKDATYNNSQVTGLWGKASGFCQKRRAFLLMDPPDSWTTVQIAAATSTGVATLRTGLVKDYSAIFYPRVIIRENDEDIKVGPSGAIAGLIARIDSNRGVWKAPAGTEADIRGISGLSLNFTDNENGVLNQRAINAIRSFTSGIVNWGARTMDGDDDFQSEYKYIPVRRLALFLEESLYRGLKWAVFEPNDEALWTQIRLNAGAFMHDLFTQGAFQGTNPRDAYFVKCDKETTTQNDINKGIVNIWVGFAPLKPAEFVMLYIQQMAGEINT